MKKDGDSLKFARAVSSLAGSARFDTNRFEPAEACQLSNIHLNAPFIERSTGAQGNLRLHSLWSDVTKPSERDFTNARSGGGNCG